MCNKISMDFKLQPKWDWMNKETNKGHTITEKLSQIPTKQYTGHGSRKQCYL